jgi:hypothetical protein
MTTCKHCGKEIDNTESNEFLESVFGSDYQADVYCQDCAEEQYHEAVEANKKARG